MALPEAPPVELAGQAFSVANEARELIAGIRDLQRTIAASSRRDVHSVLTELAGAADFIVTAADKLDRAGKWIGDVTPESRKVVDLNGQS